MKKLRFETKVAMPAEKVFEQFDQMLFETLIPKFPPVKLVNFDGGNIGGKVHLKLWVFGTWQDWVSVIVDRGEDEHGFYFIDEGERLPFFLSKWRHIHRIDHAEEGSIIVDDISYKSSWKVPGPAVDIALRKQFKDRRPVYRKYFKL